MVLAFYLLFHDHFLFNWQVVERKHHSPIEITITIQRSVKIVCET